MTAVGWWVGVGHRVRLTGIKPWLLVNLDFLSVRFLVCAPVQCFPTSYFVMVHMENVFVQLSRVMEIPS